MLPKEIPRETELHPTPHAHFKMLLGEKKKNGTNTHKDSYAIVAPAINTQQLSAKQANRKKVLKYTTKREYFAVKIQEARQQTTTPAGRTFRGTGLNMFWL